MTQRQLNRAVARATGESTAFIERLGFEPHHDPEPAERGESLLVLDCPFCGRQVLLSPSGPEYLPELAECVHCDTVYDYQDAEVYEAVLQ